MHFQSKWRDFESHRGSLVLMKGVRSKRNLYALQVGSGILGHKSDDDLFWSRRVTYKDDKSIGL